ncbi:von Willebrand factor type A [Leptolyngbya boryana NIES-2135]|jgi:Ca-activated chloride channel family protein|uniref:von Willebrand factor type A n=1 Tax=Leptolyngbya boryana NIES-2135 TaxID=1973484 RepID=A0A1Z4JBT3_LEPBY|nr:MULTISPECIES: VWA domain-containing protein [Leptolyngbya]BAY54153.1 von Willebrand factor type A [Leptolyngbya boryana NIES-2135]MBD2371014.1 VWA domain-containing protein [Leptolyngbya sp. FACHB-161]MBD2377528.1 VWA domain-containing protein [Leptolyngbya sp. FACHB-238]MBD2401936.1 VWA domain-containing protein [Leptolyngbya sp. FACHB-239]MBD2408454.1 VWA domain-containing protein [Leptolyngbya sp. FACHB-402]
MLNLLFKPHRASLKANAIEPQKVFVMLKLIPQAEVAQSRPPLALALVIDTSSSMLEFADQQQAQVEIQQRGLRGTPRPTADGGLQGYDLALPTKLDRAIEAATLLIDDSRLAPEDRVTIVHFDDRAETLLPLTPLTDKKPVHQAVTSLKKYSGGTLMGQGLEKVHQQLADLPADIAKRVLLLTDGQTFDEPDCEAIAPRFGKTNTPLITIGIGNEYNQDLLMDLSQVSQGRHYHLQQMTELQGILDEEVGSSVREVVTDLQATIATVKGVQLDSVTRIYPSLSEATYTDSRYRLGNVTAGDFTVFILEFTVSGIERPPSRVRIAQVGLTGSAPGLSKREEFPVQNLFVDFTLDEAAIATVDSEVLGFVQQKNLDRMVQEAVRLSTVDVARAQQTLQVAVGMTKRVGNAAVTKMLENALEELNQTGQISVGTAKTVRAGGRTKTIKPGSDSSLDGVPSEEEIRRLTGA